MTEHKVFLALFPRYRYTMPKKDDQHVRHIMTNNEISYATLLAIYRNYALDYIIRTHTRRMKLVPAGKRLCHSTAQDLALINMPLFQLLRLRQKKCGIPISDSDMTVVETHDHFTSPDHIRAVATKSKQFEDRVARCVPPGTPYLTQDQIVEGKLYPVTPDLLFYPHSISWDENTRLYWIDAKYMFGGDNQFTRNQLKKQATKYNKAFGPGAFVFRYSFCKDLTIQGTTLISYATWKEASRRASSS